MKYREANFDGLVGPTHNYAGLSEGNLASTSNKGRESKPKEALFQALDKAKSVRESGIDQFVLPPHERPHVPTLRKMGFTGTDKEVIEAVYNESPHLLAVVSSASSMWAANAATVAPSVDTKDSKLHLTVASLGEKLHRSIEGPVMTRILRAVFNENIANVHDPLPLHPSLGDEGAANHMRFAENHEDEGVHLFVYGQDLSALKLPSKHPARQTLTASKMLANLNQLNPKMTVFAQQNPDAIDAGVFHNDVISVNNRNAWLLHSLAYVDTAKVVDDVKMALNSDLHVIMAEVQDLSFEDAAKSYIFNSQIITLPDGSMQIIVPQETIDNQNARKFLEKFVADPSNPINQYVVANVTESMRNGGGPACLRLRVVLSDDEMANVKANARVFLDDDLFKDLHSWGDRYYRDTLKPNDLRDPNLLKETREALDALTQILNIGSVYDFQRTI